VAGGLLRINGAALPSKDKFEEAAARRGQTHSEEHLFRYAWMQISKIAQDDVALARRITAIANQNLGIHLYEHVCNVFQGGHESEEAVLQTGQHAVNVSSVRGGGVGEEGAGKSVVEVKFEACFQLVPFDSIDDLAGARIIFASVAVLLAREADGDAKAPLVEGAESLENRDLKEATSTEPAAGKGDREGQGAATTNEQERRARGSADVAGTVTYQIHRPVLPMRANAAKKNAATPSSKGTAAAAAHASALAASEKRRKFRETLRRFLAPLSFSAPLPSHLVSPSLPSLSALSLSPPPSPPSIFTPIARAGASRP